MSKSQIFIKNLSSNNPSTNFNMTESDIITSCNIPKYMVVDKYLIAEEGFEFNKKIAILPTTVLLDSSDAENLGDLMKREPDSGNDEYMTVINSHHIDAT